MKAGRLRERITFQRRTTALNEYGEGKDVWRDMVSVKAEVEQIMGSGREFFAALQLQSDVTTRISCRYSKVLAEVKPQDRVIHGAAIYDIRHPPIDVKSRHRELLFMCTQHLGE
jgi:SPP1 family predicted phage head-tail adaptor